METTLLSLQLLLSILTTSVRDFLLLTAPHKKGIPFYVTNYTPRTFLDHLHHDLSRS